jgi:hypothetical protein
MGADGIMTELVFRAEHPPAPPLVVRVNFGVFAGRNATQAEIEDLARELAGEIDSFAVVAEDRHEFGDDVEASLRQIVIELPAASDDLEDRVLRIAETWARECIHSRSNLGDLDTQF